MPIIPAHTQLYHHARSRPPPPCKTLAGSKQNQRTKVRCASAISGPFLSPSFPSSPGKAVFKPCGIIHFESCSSSLTSVLYFTRRLNGRQVPMVASTCLLYRLPAVDPSRYTTVFLLCAPRSQRHYVMSIRDNERSQRNEMLSPHTTEIGRVNRSII